MSEIVCPLYDMARMAPNQIGWMEGGRGYSYPALHLAAETVRRRLEEEFGVKAGDRVVVTAGAGWRWIPLLFGVLRAGAVLCPLNTRLPEGVLRARAEGLGAAVQICGDTGEPLLAGVPCVRMGDLCEATFLDAGPGVPVRLELERAATCLYTTGSMGRPRALVHALEAHYYAALGANRNLPMNQRHRYLLSLPLYHAGGMSVLFRCVMTGTVVVCPDAGEGVVEAVLRHGITHVSLVPTQLVRMLGDGRCGELRGKMECVLLGGAPIPREAVRRALDAGIPVYPTYGMTETAAQVCTMGRFSPVELRVSTDGAVLDHRLVRISAEGEILVRGHVLPMGEWRDGALRGLALQNDWLATGDLGRLEGGYLTVTGRKDNQFVSGGENIQPEEIERVLAEVTGAETVVVVPVPDAEFGARPAAWLRLDGEAFAEAEWDRALRERLPGYMIPVRYLRLPESPGLKPDRRDLTVRAEEVD